jgi:hypothetical protein
MANGQSTSCQNRHFKHHRRNFRVVESYAGSIPYCAYKVGENVISLFVPVILCFTVVASVGLGIGATYATVIGILHAFGRASQPEVARQRPRLVLVPTQSQASGD